MSHAVNPIILTTVGDVIIGRGRVLALVWTGQTDSGDTVELNGANFWEATTDSNQTYLSTVWAPYGIPIPPGGVKLTQISNGKVLVYLNEA